MPAKPSANAVAELPLKPVMFHVLLVLLGGERHGYRLVRDIEQRTAGQLQLYAGNLYRTLRTMRSRGLIDISDRRPETEHDDERRRYFQITPFGAEVAKAEARRLEQLVAEARDRQLLAG